MITKLITLVPKPYLIGLSIAVVLGVFGYGFIKGKSYAEASYEEDRLEFQKDLFDLADDISVKNAEILALQKTQKDLANALEIEANNADGSDNDGIATTGGLQRLERRWGSN